MYRKYKNFIRGLSVNRISITGIVLTTSAFTCFIFFELLRLAGVLTNAYLGLVTYLLFPAMFILGLLLIPIGWFNYCKSKGKTSRQLLNVRFDQEETTPRRIGSQLFLTILGFTIINVLFLSIAGIRTLKFMDQPRFCGTACHNVMSPEWTTYQVSPHARVKCVDCHVGEGMKAMIDSKLSGLRQMIKATFNTYQRPIPVPVHQLRPARETCEKCHWPEKFYGNRLKIIERYGLDEKSTKQYVTLSLKIDTGRTAAKSGIHWHIATENQVRYASLDDQRETMLWVDVRRPGGTLKRYTNRRYASSSQEKENQHIRILDCVDCHNRATHIYETPGHAIDERFSRELFPRSFPYAKRELLAAITIGYNDHAAAMKGIKSHIEGFYRRNYPQLATGELAGMEKMIAGAQEIYTRNIHHNMNVDWGTYPSYIGHEQGSGCFRCHHESMQDEEGNILSYECTLCHSILAYGEDNPFEYLELPGEKSPNYPMHQVLREEFLHKNQK